MLPLDFRVVTIIDVIIIIHLCSNRNRRWRYSIRSMYLAGKMILRKRQREEMGSNSLAAHFRVLNGQEKLVDPEALSWVPGNSSSIGRTFPKAEWIMKLPVINQTQLEQEVLNINSMEIMDNQAQWKEPKATKRSGTPASAAQSSATTSSRPAHQRLRTSKLTKSTI